MASIPSRLAPCPRTPNCVSTQAPEGSSKRMDPIPYTGTLDQARARMLQVLRDHPRTRIVQEEPGYLKAECRSRVFRFVDDVEILFDDEARQIHFRSASRLGRRDFGVNRERMETIRAAFLATPEGPVFPLLGRGLEGQTSGDWHDANNGRN